jgi:DNA polymerase V
MDGSIAGVYRTKRSTRLSRPLFQSQLPAGWPSPADDYIEERIDLNRDLILHPLYTYYARIAGDSMIGEGLYDGSLVAFDRSLEAHDGDIVVASVSNSDLCCKIYREGTGGEVWLEPANPAHPLIPITEEMELRIIGLVTFSVQWHAKRYGRRLRLGRLQ